MMTHVTATFEVVIKSTRNSSIEVKLHNMTVLVQE